MKLFVLGIVVGIVAVLVFVYVYMATGSLPVATAASPLPLEKKLANMDLRARAMKEMPKEIPIQTTEENLRAGAKVYIQQCAACHGLPGEPRPAISTAMFPPPPQLYTKEGSVADDPPAETYWKVQNGIRLTGMPAFKGILSDTELWQVALLLASTNNATILQQEEEQGESAHEGAGHPGPVVNMTDDALSYTPRVITIRAGQTVEWKNSSREVHTITADPKSASNPKDVALPQGAGAFNSGLLNPGQTYERKFEKPGTYRYVCTLHEAQHMIGEVIVKP